MKIIESKDVTNIIRNTLNLVNPILMDHGERVAYIIYKMLRNLDIYDKKDMINACIISLFHDIGAYKTDEIDRLIQFETKNVWEHSIYGYLFVKNLSPLKDMSDAILYHHLDYDDYAKVEFENKTLAALLKLADRIDIYMIGNDGKFNYELYDKLESTQFNEEYVELFIKSNEKYGIINKIIDGSYIDELLEFLSEAKFDDKQINEFLSMLVYSIDFRSEYTVTHNIVTVRLSIEIAKAMNLTDDSIYKITYGAWLHDVGKIAIPVSILEKPGKLSDSEMNIMKTHVTVTENILRGYIDNEICEISARHHEKLDGSGYPRGLLGSELTREQRIVAIADIISALIGTRSYKEAFGKDKIISILKTMVDENKICPEIVAVVIDNYDKIVGKADENSKEIIKKYNSIKYEYIRLHDVYIDR